MYVRFASLLSMLAASMMPSASIAEPVLPATFQGYFHWSSFGEAPQQVMLVLESSKIENGVITASGRELYFTGKHFQEAPIVVRIEVAKRRFELRHLPDHTNFTDGSCVPEVLVGRISADMTSVAGPHVEDSDSPAIPDFAFSATRVLASR